MSVNNYSRRGFIKAVATSGAVATTSLAVSGCGNDSNETDSSIEFRHGVASGDPLMDKVIIWSRITPLVDRSYDVDWEISTDATFGEITNSGQVSTDASNDYTVKVDVSNLSPGVTYYYRFSVDGITSDTGMTRTLPETDPESVKIAVFSCANYPAGFFHAYAEAASDPDVVFAIHLGDYIYEYPIDGYASEDAETLGRLSEPSHELISLQDYRTRYAQYRTDTQLQSIHAKMPFICVWDDHEFVNDTYIDGAENHDAQTEGEFLTRQANALKAYYEWLPIREQDSNQLLKIYRSFDIGTLFSLHMLDTRIIARDRQLDFADYTDPATGTFDAVSYQADLTDTNRQLMGVEQTNWLLNQLSASQATWQILGQQVLMGKMEIPAPVALQQIGFGDYSALLIKASVAPDTLTEQEQALLNQPSIPYNLDAWDGYPVNRERVLATAVEQDKNLVVLSGDTHNAWASNLSTLDGTAVGVEFATSSVSSPGFEEYLVEEDPAQVAAGLVQLIDPLKFANTKNRGYLTLSITEQEIAADWVFVDSVKSADYTVVRSAAKSLITRPGGENRILVEPDAVG